MTAPILVMAVGNESRGDDALGPLLARRLETWLTSMANATTNNEMTMHHESFPHPCPLPPAGEGDTETRFASSTLMNAWLGEQVEVIEEFQLQVEHTLDIQGRTLVLIIDAGHNTQTPFSFYEAKARKLDGHTTHAVAPEALLGIYAAVHRELPPPAFILCVAGMSFELGEPLSPPAEQHLEQAFVFCQQLFHAPAQNEWLEIAGRQISLKKQSGIKEYAA